MRLLPFIWESFRMKVLNRKHALFFLVILVVAWRYSEPVLRLSRDVNYPVSPCLFPFLMCSYSFLAQFWFGVVYVGSDAPFMQHVNMFQVIRTGRRVWAVGQIVGIILRSFVITAETAFCAMVPVLFRLDLSAGWGKLLHTVAMKPEMGTQYGFNYAIFYDALTRFSPLELMLLCILITSLVVSFVGVLMFTVGLYAGRTLALAVATGLTLSLFLVLNLPPMLRQGLAYFIPTIWPEIARIGSKSIGRYMLPGIPYMLLFLAVGIAVMSVLILWKVRTVEFSWEDEDI